MRHRTVTYSRDSAFNALADPTRRAVLDLLRAGTRPAGEIARAFPISRPAISKHLKILRRAHLVDEHREGRHRFYQLNPEPLKTVDQWLDEYRRFWTANLESLKSFVESEYEKEMNATQNPTPKTHSRRKDP
ncbi:MAG TPA: metalloregulator ArsR/SmtB family transcription factor [Terriglobales bacterium]|jgi:DNA-binding transcriptional ArsR family regulator|nr:metalloregulator ArsR/SmtB family transcription factor [Terriglobales bacterium]